MRGPESPGEDGAYYFLSYAHASRDVEQGAEDPDIWVKRLFKDLSADVAQLTGLPVSRAGFMDRELRSGNEWPWQLSRNLATCRVFVPLYSRRYFQSVHCGREWSSFRSRARNGAAQGTSHAETIIPVLWSPVRPDQFPLTAKSIHFEPRELGDTYAENGFYGIMKVTRYRDDYIWAVLQLARRIVEVAEQTRVPPGPAIDYDALPNAFEEGAPLDVPGDKWLRIIVAAPHRGDLPPGRSGNYYGEAATDWNPYAPESVQPLAGYARMLARYHGYRPEVSDLYEQAGDLCSVDGPAIGPAVLLVDPWEATRERCQRILARFDGLSKPWVQLVVMWNRRDAEMTAREDELRAALDAAMPLTRRERVRATAWHAVRGVPSLEDLTPVLGDAMRHAARQYLKYADGTQAGGATALLPRPRDEEED
ncbi:MAG: TIR-like protein FxsC, partial [Trebonia sp.]